MNEKPNNGGENQPYAPAGSKDANGEPAGGRWMAETDVTQEEIENFIKGSPFAEQYASMDDAGKKGVRDKIVGMVRWKKTQEFINQKYDDVDESGWTELAQQNKEALQQKYGAEASTLYNYFRYKYRGTPRSFDLNKPLRIGWQKSLEWFDYAMKSDEPQLERYRMRVSSFPSRQEVEEFTENFDKLTHSFKAKKNMAVYRFVNDDVACSWFKDVLIRAGAQVSKGFFGYDVMDTKKFSVDKMVEILQDAVGQKVDGDTGFSSFSTCRELSHMRRSTGEDFRRFEIKYDVPEGQDLFISDYRNESEGVFPRGLKMVIKSVTKGTDEYGERVVVQVGIIK